MINLDEEFKQPKNYVILLLGILIGAGALGYVASYRYEAKNMTQGQVVNNLQPANANPEDNYSESYKEALKNPDKPYTDENGVQHPPIGAIAKPLTAEELAAALNSAPPVNSAVPASATNTPAPRR